MKLFLWLDDDAVDVDDCVLCVCILSTLGLRNECDAFDGFLSTIK